jgi:hypothetical protein
MRFLVAVILSIAVIAVAFNLAKPLPGTNFDESFLPKASSVKYIAAGNDASVAGLFWIKGLTEMGESFLSGKEYAYLGHVANLCTELDSLFYTPYYFVSGLSTMDSKDTSDFQVFRRALRVFPEDWKIAVSFALRLSKGPYPDNRAAADVMRPYFDYPDSTIPPHIRLMYRTFELDQEQTETALEMILNDLMQPRFKKFRAGFYNKTFRVLGYKGIGAIERDSTTFNDVKETIDLFVERKIPPQMAFNHLLSLRKAEAVKPVEPAADTVASVADTTAAAADTSAAVADTTANN